MVKVSFILMIGFLMAISACSDKTTDDVRLTEIYQDYRARYQDANTEIEIYYFEGKVDGDRLELESASDLTVNGSTPKLKRDDDDHAFYVLSLPGYVDEITFIWNTRRGETYTNIMHLAQAQIDPAPTTFVRGQPFVIEWSGDGLNSDTIDIALTSKLIPTRRVSIDASGSFSGTFTADDLKKIPAPGADATVSIQRWREQAITQGTESGGRMLFYCVGKTYEVAIE